jgi:hypothetical protein
VRKDSGEDGLVEATVGESGGGRRCKYPGCTTTLSVYNSDFLCWTHASVEVRARFDRLSARSRPATKASSRLEE